MRTQQLLTAIFLTFGISACSGGGSSSSPAPTGAPPSSGGSVTSTITALPLSSTPSFAVIRNGELIWSDKDQDIALKTVSFPGGIVTPLALRFSVPYKVIVLGGDIYWSEGGRVGRLLADNSVEILAEGSLCPFAGDFGSDFSVDATYVYRLAASQVPGESDACSIQRTSIADGTVTTLLDHPNGPIYGITQDTTHIYWTELVRSSTLVETLSVKRIAKSGGTPQTLTSGFTEFTGGPVIKSGYAYFVDTTKGHDSSRILKVPVTGGLPVTLAGPITSTASNTGVPHAIAVDSNNVYWIDDQTVNSVPVTGGTKIILATGLSKGITIAVNSTDVFWIEHLCCTGGYPSRIGRVPIGGGTVSTVSDGMYGAHTLFLDSTTVYWGEGRYLGNDLGKITKVSASGGPSTTVLGGTGGGATPFIVDNSGAIYVAGSTAIKKVPPGGGPQVETLFWKLGAYPSKLTTDGSFLYFGFSTSNQLLKIPVTGGAETVLTSITNGAGEQTVAGGFFYWPEKPTADATTYSIKRIPTAGGVIETIASGIPVDGIATSPITDSNFLYWADGTRSTIYKVPLSGGSVTVLWPGSFLDGGVSLTQDDSFIYFSNINQVGKVPKSGGPATFYELLPEPRFAIGVDNTSVYWVTDTEFKKATPK